MKKNCCGNWDLDSGADLAVLAGKDYPKSSSRHTYEDAPADRQPGQIMIGPKKLSQKWLEDGVKFAYNKCVQGEFGTPAVRGYLRTYNIKTSVADNIAELAQLDRKNGNTSHPDDFVPKVWSLVDCHGSQKILLLHFTCLCME